MSELKDSLVSSVETSPQSTGSATWSVTSKWAKLGLTAGALIFTVGFVTTLGLLIVAHSSSATPAPDSTGLIVITPWQAGGLPAQNDSSWNSTSSSVSVAGAPTDACLAPVGTWGPVCTSRVGFNGAHPDTMISYSIEPTVDTPVFCKVLGSACDGFGYSCCWALHPRTANVGNPVWQGDTTIVWGQSIGTPQIQCYSSAVPTTVQWGWTGGQRGKFGCFGGYNCNLQPNGC